MMNFSAFLCIYVAELMLVLVVIYHPFWNDCKADEEAISCITEVVDYGYLKFGPSCKFVICGDFNDLHKSYDVICNVTQFSCLIDFPTRNLNTLDQIITNYNNTAV